MGRPKPMPTTDTDTVVDTDTVDTDTVDTVDTDTTEARGPLMLNPRLTLLPPLKPKLMPMLTVTDTVDTMAVDTTDTDVLTDITVARGLLMPPPKLPLLPPLKPKLMPMLTTDTVDTMVVELLLKQKNKPLKLQLSGSSHSKFFQF